MAETVFAGLVILGTAMFVAMGLRPLAPTVEMYGAIWNLAFIPMMPFSGVHEVGAFVIDVAAQQSASSMSVICESTDVILGDLPGQEGPQLETRRFHSS